jgi:hypothetical protein
MKPLLIFAAAILLVVAANSRFAGLSAELKNDSTSANRIPPVNIPLNLGQSNEAGPEVKLVLLALLPHGFETNEMHLDPGDYLLIVGNRTGLREVNVQLERGGKERVASAIVRGSRTHWKQRLKLTRGTYLVTADNNPDWTCRLIVGP